MLEHFVWVPEVIIRLSKHHTALNTKESNSLSLENKMPRELAEAVARTKLVGKATGLMSFIQPSLFDLAIYTPKTHQEAIDMDTTALWNETKRLYAPYQAPTPTEETMFGQASISSFFRGYDVGYFTYVMWVYFVLFALTVCGTDVTFPGPRYMRRTCTSQPLPRILSTPRLVENGDTTSCSPDRASLRWRLWSGSWGGRYGWILCLNRFPSRTWKLMLEGFVTESSPLRSWANQVLAKGTTPATERAM